MGKRAPGIDVGRLAQMMELRGFTTDTDLARASGVSHDIIHLIRTREGYKTSGANAASLALALECSLDYLMGLSDAPNEQLQMQRSPETEEVAQLMERMSASAREEVGVVVAALADLDRRRDKRADEYERLIHLLQQRIAPEDYAELMPLLLRAAWSNDGATFDDIIARYGVADRSADKQA